MAEWIEFQLCTRCVLTDAEPKAGDEIVTSSSQILSFCPVCAVYTSLEPDVWGALAEPVRREWVGDYRYTFWRLIEVEPPEKDDDDDLL